MSGSGYLVFSASGISAAELNPLGLLPPQPHPDLQIDSGVCAGSTAIYCGSVGAEFMHIADPERRRWIQERLEGKPGAVDQERALDLLMRADLFEQTLQSRYLGNKRSHSKGILLCCRWWMKFWMWRGNVGRWSLSWDEPSRAAERDHHIASGRRSRCLPSLRMSIPAACWGRAM